jgi:hypothetical protein
MEPEGFESPPTRRILENTLVKRPRPRHSQCRGRGFESHHLHRKPRSQGRSGIPQKIRFSDVSLRAFTGHMVSCEIPVHASQCGVEQSLNICERSVFLEKGQVRFEGATRDLMSRDDIARAVFLGSQYPQER